MRDGRVADLYPPPKRLAVLLHISQEALKSYVMRTLPDSEVEPLEVHLFVCSDCRDRLVAVLNAASMRAAVGKQLWQVVRQLGTDYAPYGEVKRDGSDCSCGCRHFIKLAGDLGNDWGVCCKAGS
jgi:hypothetical protein